MRSIFLIFLLILAGCSSSPETTEQSKADKPEVTQPPKKHDPDNMDPNAGRYSLEHDKAPDVIPVLKNIKDAVPRYEPRSLAGNKDYTLRGKRYHIIKNPKGFTQTGYASWYGMKFHGHKTANGETYDIYDMTAAHKTLPIPSYVKVTNTRNGKTAIVRVNDRGPFHDGRIIDLSLAAATKLDVVNHGTAPVKIEVISVPKPTTVQGWHAVTPHYYYVQLAAVAGESKAEEMKASLRKKYGVPVNTQRVDTSTTYRVRLGPYLDHDAAQHMLDRVKVNQYPKAFITTVNR
ncbi:septal ring lytic transglycosylase RlpA family protein [Photobacterium damselae]|uniref:septal ring lytic transglycosylase RlpA family protein n=1 Tax=Photobacterium damselae TaxID=38293 RepID=UPI004068B196